jgi:hypothetical protein
MAGKSDRFADRSRKQREIRGCVSRIPKYLLTMEDSEDRDWLVSIHQHHTEFALRRNFRQGSQAQGEIASKDLSDDQPINPTMAAN